MGKRVLIAAFLLDAACALAAPFVFGLYPKQAEAAETQEQLLIFSDGQCHELVRLDIAQWQIVGEADPATCQASHAD